MKDSVKLIAMDLDDTLLKDDLTISDYTVSVLQAVMKKGILAVLASGRSPRAVYPYAQRIGSDTAGSFMVCYNGSQTLSSNMQDIIAEHRLTAELAVAVFNFIEAHHLSCHLYVDDKIYAALPTVFSEKDSHLTNMKLVIPDDYRQVLRTQPVYKLVVPALPDVIAAVEPEFQKKFGGQLVIFTSKPYFLELIPLNTGKGEALQELAMHLGLAENTVMAFGDSMNDATMLRHAGYGIAMKNGLPAIRESAYAVTDYTNNEDGVARFLEKHIL